MKKFLSLLSLLVIGCAMLSAQDADHPTPSHERAYRPISGSLELHLGSASVRNTYLAPMLYSGSDYGLAYERTRRWRNLDWMSLQQLSGQFAMATDPGVHSDQWAGRLRYRYAALYAIDLYYLALMVGPSAGTDVGFDYNLKMGSSNNPATAHLTANVGLQLMATLPYRLWNRGCLASLQLHAPLLGYALMPEYGASYYETFSLGHTTALHHFTSLHNQQDFDLRLTTDVPLSRHRGGALRLGVDYHIETLQINQVTTRFSSFEAVVGWTFQCLPVKFSAKGLSYEVY